jgi:Flp pilus assembly protein TadB
MRHQLHGNGDRPRWEDFFQPIEGPPPEQATVHAPIRDDAQLGPTEDLDREPDGVPHAVVGLTAFFAIILAILLLVLFVAGATVGHIAAAILLVLAVPVVVTNLKHKADRDRDHVHPSR